METREWARSVERKGTEYEDGDDVLKSAVEQSPALVPAEVEYLPLLEESNIDWFLPCSYVEVQQLRGLTVRLAGWNKKR